MVGGEDPRAGDRRVNSGESLLGSTLDRVVPVETAWIARAAERQRRLTKPEGSLGRLEAIANRVSAIQKTLTPAVDKPRILLFAADHGVADEGVSAFPRAVTAEMVRNFLAGGAAINALARANRIGLRIVDVGVESIAHAGGGLIRRRIGPGTRNLLRGPAMSGREAIDAVEVGIDLVARAVAEGCRVVGIGEMGIGNTTSAAAITAVLTGRPAEDVVGRGTGVDDETLGRKIAVVGGAVALHAPSPDDPIQVLSTLGGFEIAAMCGVCLGAAAAGTPVVVDGFISTSAAALAARLSGEVGGYLFAAHRSAEPGHGALLELIGQEPLLDLGMRLGEGTGAALGIAIVRSAVAAFNEMATFDAASVSERVGRPHGGDGPDAA